MYKVVFILVMMLLPFMAEGRQRTTRKGLEYDEEAVTVVNAADTLRAADTDIRFYGYEKVQASSKENLFVTNHTDCCLGEICITVEYVDMSGRMLHRRTEKLKTKIGPGETRMLQMKAWDSQHVWHYHNTQGKHNAYSTPFDIRIHLEYALPYIP